MIRREKFKIGLLIGIICGIVGIIVLYTIYFQAIVKTLNTIDAAYNVLIILIIRMCILAGMALIMFYQWFNQEEQYLSDLPFLFGLFFLILIFGKLLDMLTYFTYYSLSVEELLIILKIRQFVAIATLAPMVYLSIMMVLFFLSVSEKIEKYHDSRERDAVSMKILLFILFIESIVILLIPNTTVAGVIIAIFVISSLLVIVWIFAFSYKNKRLSQVHPLILAIGFAAFLCSSIFRPLAQLLLGENAIFTITVEIIDIAVFIVIFTGLFLKANYNLK